MISLVEMNDRIEPARRLPAGMVSVGVLDGLVYRSKLYWDAAAKLAERQGTPNRDDGAARALRRMLEQHAVVIAQLAQALRPAGIVFAADELAVSELPPPRRFF
jgi:hypothetical protein